jgi:hypothetical protein
MPPFEHKSIQVFLGFDFAYRFDGFARYFINCVSTQLPKGKRKKRKKREKKRKKKTLEKKKKEQRRKKTRNTLLKEKQSRERKIKKMKFRSK